MSKEENKIDLKSDNMLARVLSDEVVEKNWQKFSALLETTKRPGIDKLIEYLKDKTDMYSAPASGKYHRNTFGGLVDHSIRVYEYLNELNENFGDRYSDDTIIITGLLHDLCKANYYDVSQEWDKKYKDETNKWRQIPAYKVNEEIPLGHGEKSVIIANRFIGLTIPEMVAIRWHMSAFDPGIHFFYPSGSPFRQASNDHPLVKMIIISDLQAEFYESMYPVESIIK